MLKKITSLAIKEITLSLACDFLLTGGVATAIEASAAIGVVAFSIIEN